MRSHSASSLVVFAATAATLMISAVAQGQLIPVLDERSILAKSAIPGHVGMHGVGYSADDFTHFEQSTTSHSDAYGPCSPGSPDQCVVAMADAYAAQSSDFFDTAITFDGQTQGSWTGQYEGAYEVASIARFRFRIEAPVDYEITANVLPGNWSSIGKVGCWVELLGPTPEMSIHYTQFGFLNATGRLGPGEYVIEGVSAGSANLEYLDGGTYFGQLLVNPVTDSLIVAQPLDFDVPCGGAATFSVTPVASAGTLSYQWMRNLVPLSDDARIAGATTNTLTISDACHPDSGYYSVVVSVAGSDPPISVPSRLAHLGIAAITGIVDDPTPTARAASFSAPSPNPFRAATRVRYSVPNATRLRAAVYDVRGARVRHLVDELVAGSGSVVWDGLTQFGEAAPAGIYFVRIDAGSFRQTKKVTLLQ